MMLYACLIWLSCDVDECYDFDMLKNPSSWHLFVNLINVFCRIYAMRLEMINGMLDDMKIGQMCFLSHDVWKDNCDVMISWTH